MRKILIMDSDEALLETLSQEMIAAGYEPIAVTTAQEGLTYAEEASFIIIAVELPDQNGFVTCGTLKRNPNTVNIPIFMMSSAESTAEFERHLTLPVHADGYYLKPLDIPAMLQEMQTIFDEIDAYAAQGYDPNAPQDGVYYDENGYPVQDGYAETDGEYAQDSQAMTDGEYAQDGNAMTDGEYAQDSQAMTDGEYVQDSQAMTDGEYTQDSQAMTDGEYAQDSQAMTDGEYAQDGNAALEDAFVQDINLQDSPDEAQISAEELPVEEISLHDEDAPQEYEGETIHLDLDTLQAAHDDAPSDSAAEAEAPAEADELDNIFNLATAQEDNDTNENGGEMIKSLALDDMSLFADIDADQLEDPVDPFLDDEPFSLTPEEPAEIKKPEPKPDIPPVVPQNIAPLSASSSANKSISPVSSHAIPPVPQKLSSPKLAASPAGLPKPVRLPPAKPAGIGTKSDKPGLPPISAISKPKATVEAISTFEKKVEIHHEPAAAAQINHQEIDNLNAKLQKAEAEIEQLRTQNAELRAHIEELNQNNDQLAMLASDNEIQKDKLQAIVQQLSDLLK